ncbi:hypothetical protein Tcan_10492 [Toxocara canis]|uniref:Activin_recp domain-containing protein n=1 Tax=Toxocara canis TaxID=6265 RepID=A0A0B2V6B8_TOXCA|nr:hypothetical protein Tcan_10492 [Toxocara canis]
MLDHAVTGVHYACSQSDLPSEQCQKRTTKSGVEVNVCSCNSDDFCNYKNWPLKKMETKLNNDDHAITPAPVTVSTASTNTPLLATFLAFLVFRYFFTFPRI